MSQLKILSGEKVIKIFLLFDFKVAAQKGSHVKLARIKRNGTQ